MNVFQVLTRSAPATEVISHQRRRDIAQRVAPPYLRDVKQVNAVVENISTLG